MAAFGCSPRDLVAATIINTSDVCRVIIHRNDITLIDNL
jgi:hypothetical protein